MSITAERKQQVDFSKKYYNTPPAIVVPKDSDIAEATPEALAGKSLGAQIVLTPAPRFAFTANYIGGPEQADDNRHLRHLVDVIAVGKLTSALTLTGTYER